MQLDHVTIRTRDLDAARSFFTELFELEEGRRPTAIQHIPGHWMYSGDEPIVHLIRGPGDEAGASAEAIDHVGFRREDYASFRARVEQLGIRHSFMDLPEIGQRRIFVWMPDGPVLETVFDSDDAKEAVL